MDNDSLIRYVCSLSDEQIAEKYEYLGEGIGRIVYAINEDYVVKVAKGEDGIYQNRVENYVYDHASEELEKYLCPVVWFQPDRIIMPRAIPLAKYHKSKNVDLNTIRPEETSYEDLNRLSQDFMLDYEDIVSVSSWGIYENENVLIDYGCTNFLGDAAYYILFKW